MITPRNKREERLVTLEEMKLCLSVKAFSTAEMVEKFCFEQNTIRKYLKLIPCDPDHRIFIEKWEMYNLRWVPYYRYGTGEDVPMPRMTQREKQDKQTIRRHKKKAGTFQRVYTAPMIKRKRPPTRSPEQIAEEREAFERRQRAAEIVPHRDPWAHLFHGGVTMLVGARV